MKVIRTGTGLLEALEREAAIQRYCRNCGDPSPSLDDADWNGRIAERCRATPDKCFCEAHMSDPLAVTSPEIAAQQSVAPAEIEQALAEGAEERRAAERRRPKR